MGDAPAAPRAHSIHACNMEAIGFDRRQLDRRQLDRRQLDRRQLDRRQLDRRRARPGLLELLGGERRADRDRGHPPFGGGRRHAWLIFLISRINPHPFSLTHPFSLPHLFSFKKQQLS